MTPAQKKAMEYYSPRQKATGGATTGYTRNDVELRSQQLANNSQQRFQRKQLEAEAKLKLYVDAMASGQLQSQVAATNQLTRQAAVARSVVRNQVLQQDVSSGSYHRHTEATGMLDREHALVSARAQAAAMEADQPAWSEHEAKMRPLQRRMRHAQAERETRAGNDDYRAATSSGDEQRQQQVMTELNREHEKMAVAVRNEVAARDLETGSYRKHAAEMAKLDSQYRTTSQRMAQVRREEDLSLKYGQTLGGFLARNQGAMQAAGAGAAGLLALAHGSAVRGRQGTVEENRDEMVQKQLDRETAGIFKPLTDLKTRAKEWGLEKMRGTGGSQQNLLMYGMLGGSALAGGGLAWTAARMLGMGGKGRLLAMLAGAGGGGLAGAGGGDLVGGGLSLAASIGGPALLSRLWRGKAAAGAASAAAGAAPTAGAATAASAAAAGGTWSAIKGAGRWAWGGAKWGAKKVPYLGALVMAGEALSDANKDPNEGTYYQYHRAAGRGKTMAGIGSALDSLSDWSGASSIKEWFGGKSLEDRRREEVGLKPKQSSAEAHRSMTLAGGGFESMADAYERLQESASMKDDSYYRGVRRRDGSPAAAEDQLWGHAAAAARGPEAARDALGPEARDTALADAARDLRDAARELRRGADRDERPEARPLSRPEG